MNDNAIPHCGLELGCCSRQIPYNLSAHDKLVHDEAYQKGRADALTEIITHISACENEAYDNVEPIIGSVLMAIRIKAEQLKEQKNE